MTVRAAREQDIPALCAIEAACFSDPWSAGAIAAQLAAPTGLSLIAEENGAPLGALFLSCLPPEGEVYRLCVLPAARRRGVGRLLLARGLEAEREAGVLRMFLDVRASNEPALSLYRAFGFTECGRRAGYYRAPREDAVLMEREVREDEIFGH